MKKKEMIAPGSGFVVSDKGKIVTNYHAINNATYVHAIDNNDKEYEVQNVLQYDVEKDLAVLQLKTDTLLPAVNIGDSDNGR